MAAHLAATGQQDRLACFSLLVTVLDTANAGTVAALTDRQLAAAAKAMSARRGYLDGRALAEVFAWLRPGDLVWNYWVNNYLLGSKPPAFDILFWNADTTRMSATLHADFVDLAMDNKLITPGKLTVLGTPIDLSQVDSRFLHRRRDRRPHHPLAELLPQHAAARRGKPVHPVHQRSHRRARQPARQPEGHLPDQQDQPGQPGGLAEDRALRAGQLVARHAGLARRPVRRGQASTNRTRRRRATAARRSARHLRLRQLTRAEVPVAAGPPASRATEAGRGATRPFGKCLSIPNGPGVSRSGKRGSDGTFGPRAGGSAVSSWTVPTT